MDALRVAEEQHEDDLQAMKLAIVECISGANSRIEAVGTAHLLREFIDDIIAGEYERDRENTEGRFRAAIATE
jgi:hypothetical protein